MDNNIIVKTQELRHFFYLPEKGICCKALADPAMEILLEDGYFDFDVAPDGKGSIHLICQDMSGAIIYLCFIEGKWRKTVLLESKSQTVHPKYFKLVMVNGHINLFYVIQYSEQSMLVHQLLDNYDAIPTVLDYVSSGPSFAVDIDAQNNLYCFYTNEEGQLREKVYRWSEKKWGEGESVATNGEKIFAPFCVIRDNTIHLAYVSRTDKFYSVCYKQCQKNWSDEKNLYFDCGGSVSPVITCGSEIYISWLYQNKPSIYQKGGENTFQRNSKLEVETTRHLGRTYIKINDWQRSSCTLGFTEKDGTGIILCPELLNIEKRRPIVVPKGRDVEQMARPAAQPQPAPAIIEEEKTKITLEFLKNDLTKDLNSIHKDLESIKRDLSILKEELIKEKSF